MKRDDEIVEPDIAYSAEALNDLSDDQLIAIRDDVKRILDERAEKCERLLKSLKPKRTRKAKADK